MIKGQNNNIVKTQDGSQTVYSAVFGEHYHSQYGAFTESNHIYIQHGLLDVISKGNKSINILEIGFGTGLNALLSYVESEQLNIKINYITSEPYPLLAEEFTQLKYAEFLNNNNLVDVFNKMHLCFCNTPFYISDIFILNKINEKIQDIALTEQSFDVIYFDAFSPDIQPEIWDLDIFEKMYNCLKKDGFIVTYCSKGVVKRTMKAAGFIIEEIEGPIGKRVITKAIKK